MNMFNKLPTKIEINKKWYFINSDFRLMISFEQEMQNIKDLPKEEQKNIVFKKMVDFCPAFFNSNFTSEDFEELSKKFIYFYKCGRENYHKTSGGGEVSKSSIYSYEYDDEYIYGAFMQYYPKYDLTKDYIHWWKFKAMLKSLPDDCKFEQIKSYRSYKGKDEDAKKLKSYWELPISTKEQEELDKIAEQLMKYNKK